LGKRGQQKVDLFTRQLRLFDSHRGARPPGMARTESGFGVFFGGRNGWCGMGWKLEIGSIERNTRDGIPIAYSTGQSPGPVTSV